MWNNKTVKRLNKSLRKFLHERGREYSTSVLNKHITPLVKKACNPTPFFTMDIETIDFKGYQIPLLITSKVTSRVKVFKINNISNDAVYELWINFFKYLISNSIEGTNTIFTHNLGGFDGVFLQKFVSRYFDNSNVDIIIDDSKSIISITVKINGKTLVFLDSLRIFPVSLDNLCKVFNVPGKIEGYKKEWNNASILDNKELLNELIVYAKQDSQSLYEALKAAQDLYISKYKVDITSIVSMPSLANKIFRLNFLDKNIPIITGFNDMFIRNSYYGGADDIYKAYAKDVYYYDVNSLYPWAMCQPMPLE